MIFSISSGGQPSKRTQRERVRQIRAERQLAQMRIGGGNLRPLPLDQLARVHHPADERLHRLAPNPGEGRSRRSCRR